MKNRLLLSLLSLFPSRKKRPPTSPRRFLVISTTALGDTLWATPALESLRKSFPDSYIAVLTSPVGKEVLQNNPSLDKILLLNSRSFFSLFSLYRRLQKEAPDTILFFHASQRFLLPLCQKLGASILVGTAHINKGADRLLTHPLPNAKQHEIVRRLEMVRAVGGAIHSETLSFFPTTPPRAPSSKKRIAIHPGSKDGFKRWPVTHFARLATKLLETFDLEVWCTGKEDDLFEELLARVPRLCRFPPKSSLDELAEFFQGIDLLITNDTGPSHLALALERPTLILYSPTNPELCGPHKSTSATVLYKKRTCTPCLKKNCKRPFCLTQITVEEVYKAATEILCPTPASSSGSSTGKSP